MKTVKIPIDLHLELSIMSKKESKPIYKVIDKLLEESKQKDKNVKRIKQRD